MRVGNSILEVPDHEENTQGVIGVGPGGFEERKTEGKDALWNLLHDDAFRDGAEVVFERGVKYSMAQDRVRELSHCIKLNQYTSDDVQWHFLHGGRNLGRRFVVSCWRAVSSIFSE
jgi:hypothetical protein